MTQEEALSPLTHAFEALHVIFISILPLLMLEVFHFKGGDLELFGEKYMIGDSSLVMHV